MKNIRSKFVKESLLDYENLAQTLKENTSNAVKDLLSEAVMETYKQILKEEDENEYEEEVVEDGDVIDDTKESDKEDETSEETVNDEESSEEESESELNADDANLEDVETEEPMEGNEESVEDGWKDFDDFKVDDEEDTFDFTNADDSDIVRVFKLMKDNDQVMVTVDQNSNKVELKDNNADVEYIIDMGQNETTEDNLESNNYMNENRIFELVLNEYDSHMGYTDNYQKKEPMTTKGVKEPGKNVNDWDAGAPKSTSKPWGGKVKKENNKPFTENEEFDEALIDECGDMEIEEATNVGGFVQQNSTSKSHIPNSNGRKARNSSVAGQKTKNTTNPRYSTNEAKSMMKKVNTILKENAELKSALSKFKSVLEEAAVTNLNLGQIIKLISENSTTKDEKQEIITRFGKEAKTIEQSKSLYESINNELKKKNTMSINEEKQFVANNSKVINETQIYKSKDLVASLDLMARLCK